MKKITYLILLAAITALVSCSQNEILTTENGQAKPVTFRLTTDKVATRATPNAPTRYKVEVYKTDNLDTPYAQAQATSEDGNLNVTLLPGTYTCLFWADCGKHYNIDDLKNVSCSVYDYTDPALMAYCLKQDITVDDLGTPQDIELKHAVAALNLIDTKGMPAGKLVVGFLVRADFNVMTGNVSGNTEFTIQGIDISATTSETTIATFYFFAPIGEADVIEFKFGWGNSDKDLKNIIPNVPLQANYQTVIKGGFSPYQFHSFSVTADDTWGDPQNDMNLQGNTQP